MILLETERILQIISSGNQHIDQRLLIRRNRSYAKKCGSREIESLRSQRTKET